MAQAWRQVSFGLLSMSLMTGKAEENVALNKPVTMSSGWSPYWPKSNDGDRNDLCCSHCAVSYTDHQPWWVVDLQGTFTISKVYIVPRKNDGSCYGECANRVGNLDIRVGFDGTNFQVNKRCTFFSSILQPGNPGYVTCDVPTCGRYVSIRRQGEPYDHSIELCEVEVYGSATEVNERSLWSSDKNVGKYLAGHVVITSPVRSTLECFKLCLKHQQQCRSVNVYISANDAKMCDVSNDVASATNTLTSDADSTYYGLSLSTCN